MTTGRFAIRRLDQKDNLEIASIIRSVLKEFKADKPGTVFYDPTTDDLYRLFEAKNALYYIAESNGAIMGGCGIYPTPGLPEGCCELVKLYLLPAARGTGLGKELVQMCILAAKELGFQSLYLETLPELHIAAGLYEKMGFTYLPAALGNSGHFGCDLWMIKRL